MIRKYKKYKTNLESRIFGDLEVINFDEEFYKNRAKNQGYAKWLCRCKCGKIVSVGANHLLRGVTQRCFVCKIENQKLHGKFSKTQFLNIIYGAKIRNIPFSSSVTYDYLCDLYLNQNGLCAITNQVIVFANTIKEHKHGGTTASLDRINSSKGYTESNVQWIHKIVNCMKKDLDKDRFIYLCNKIAQCQD